MRFLTSQFLRTEIFINVFLEEIEIFEVCKIRIGFTNLFEIIVLLEHNHLQEIVSRRNRLLGACSPDRL